MVIGQGGVWWAELDEPVGSAPGLRRPVVVAQCNALNQSRVGTVVCVPLTSHRRWSEAPGNVLLNARATGLSRDSVAHVLPIVAPDKQQLSDRVDRISRCQQELIFAGVDIVLGR
jgi:mRNA interferase MazF